MQSSTKHNQFKKTKQNRTQEIGKKKKEKGKLGKNVAKP